MNHSSIPTFVLFGALSLSFAAHAGCSATDVVRGGDDPTGSSTGPTAAPGGAGPDETGSGDGTSATEGGSAGPNDCVPQDVAALLAKSCTTSGCHTSPGSAAKPPLTTMAHLTARSSLDGTKTVAERSVLRMKDRQDPMPTAGLLAASETAKLETWVAGGSKPVACAPGADGGAPDASTADEFAVPAKCTNGTSFVFKGATMSPGMACNGCHRFSIAGTVYPTAHEPNNCKGANVAGTTVVVTDAMNRTQTLAVNAAGNFMASSAVSAPYKVKVVGPNGKERPMATPLTAAMGDCNSCHSQNGSGNPKAPGRVLIP